MTEDNFDAKYTVDTSVKSEYFNDGRLETFGSDLETVNKIFKHNPKKVWTAIDGDDGSVWLVAGLHFVNRIYFLITNEPWNSDIEEYKI